ILDTITTALNISREQLADLRVAVIGAGGTGRTAVAALAELGATVVVYNRTKERADALAAEFDGQSGKVVAARMEKLCDSCCHIFINTTSVGMHPKVDESPLGDRLPTFTDRKSTRLNSSHEWISYAVFCFKKKMHQLGPDPSM